MKTRIFRIESIGAGFLAVMAKPGSDQIDELAQHSVGQLVCLLEGREAAQLGFGVEDERARVEAHSMQFISYPIPDLGLPTSVEAFAALTSRLFDDISTGCNTIIHCRGGIGRSGLVASGVLLHRGLDPRAAFALVSARRGRAVPETDHQRAWLQHNHRSIVAFAANADRR